VVTAGGKKGGRIFKKIENDFSWGTKGEVGQRNVHWGGTTGWGRGKKGGEGNGLVLKWHALAGEKKKRGRDRLRHMSGKHDRFMGGKRTDGVFEKTGRTESHSKETFWWGGSRRIRV